MFFLLFIKSSKTLICHLLQIISGALRTNIFYWYTMYIEQNIDMNSITEYKWDLEESDILPYVNPYPTVILSMALRMLVEFLGYTKQFNMHS